MRIEIGQVVAQILSFLVMLWVLKKYAWRPLFKIIDDRRQKIQSEFDAIEQHKREIKVAEDGYTEKIKGLQVEGLKIIQEAREKGTALFKEIENEAHTNAKSIIDAARDQLQHEVADAKVQLKKHLIQMTMLATEKIIATDMDAEKREKLIGQFIEQMESP